MKLQYRLAAQILAFAALGAMLTLLLGKDTNWDLLNYHLYTAHAFLHFDLASDFMGSSAQRYLNPIGYLPFYFMIMAGWHSALIGIALGGFQGIALFFLWRILRVYVFADTARPKTWSIAAILLAMSSPVYLGVLGGTFLDGTTLVFMMAGMLLICARMKSESANKTGMFWAGAMFGIATGLKLTSVIFGIAAATGFILLTHFRRQSWLDIIRFTFGGFTATMAVSGWWFYKLFQEFGNPVFPLFNHVFKSPDFTTSVVAHSRFMIASVEELVTLPFRMASVHSWIYVENAAPDLRFAAIVLAAVSLGVSACLAAFRRRRPSMGTRSDPINQPTAHPGQNSVGTYLIVTWVVMTVLWQLTSGNGRYALPVMLLAGPVLVLLLRGLIRSDTVLLRILVTIGALQVLHAASAGNPRWTTEPWNRYWLDIRVAQKLIAQPYGFLNVGVITHSASAVYFHQDSRITNVFGVYSIDPQGPGGDRIKRFIAEHGANLRVMFETGTDSTAESLVRSQIPGIDAQLAGWDLHVNANECESIRIPHLLEKGVKLAACLVEPGNPARERIEATRQRVTAVFNSIEARCPILFGPQGGYVLPKLGRWVREYPNHDIRLYMSRGQIAFSRFEYGPFDVALGSLDDWETGRGIVDCKIPNRPFSF